MHSGPARRSRPCDRRRRWPDRVLLRRPGAAALDLANVAAGRMDGFFEQGLNAWDVAAGSLVITEAGGLVGNYTGDSEFLHVGEVVAGNPKIYAQMIPILSRYSRTRQRAA